MEGAGGGLELVFKVGSGDGDAALNFGEAEGWIFGQVEGAMEQQVVAGGDGGGERERAEVRGQHGFKGVDGFKRGEAGGKNRAGLVSGRADGGFVFGEDEPGENGGEDFPLVLGLGEHLVADAGMLDVEGDHFAEAETQDGEGFRGAGGQGIEVEHEDADDGVGQNEGDGAGAGRDLAERGADGVGDSLGGADVGLADAGDQGAGREWNEGVDGCGAGAGERCGEDSFRGELDGGWGTTGGLAVEIDLFRKEFKSVLGGQWTVDSGQWSVNSGQFGGA